MARPLPLALALVLACGAACTSKPSGQAGAEEAGDRPAGQLSGSGPSAPSPDDRIPSPGGDVLGAQPGHMRGAFLHGAVSLAALGQLARGSGSERLAMLDAPSFGGATLSLSARDAGALGLHLRVHAPSSARALAEGMLGEDRGWTEACAEVGPTLACGGDEHRVHVLRELDGELRLDLLLRHPGPVPVPDGAALRQLLAVGADTPAEVAALRGQLGVSIDGPGVVAWLRSLDRADGERLDAIARLHDTLRMFEGVRVRGELEGSSAVLGVEWISTPQGRARMAEVFALSEVDADVPTIKALCADAWVCARSRGAPLRSRFAGLAAGAYADPVALAELVDTHVFEALWILALETWPNAIAAASRLPGTYVGPAESVMIENALGVFTRALGFGLSARGPEDYVAYARLSGADLSALIGMLKLAELEPAAGRVEGVDARVSFAPLPAGSPRGNFYGLAEPDVGAGAWGWAVLASEDARVRWLAGRAHDDGAAPLVYVELGDLWGLAGAWGVDRELASAQGWLSQRWLRAQLSLDDTGAPQLRVATDRARGAP